MPKNDWFWRLALAFFVVICFADYHYSTSNQIPSDGPLRIGFPMTFYWMVCPMMSAGTGACHQGLSTLGLVVDLITCMAFSVIAAAAAMYFALKDFARAKGVWIATVAAAAFLFVLSSALGVLMSGPHRGRALELGMPVTYLREYAGESWNWLNLAVDLILCLLTAFLVVAPFLAKKKST